ncbi:MAG: integrase [Crocinitomicaceae bacterium]|jgi:integrase
MSLKGSTTTADFLEWDAMQLLTQKLLRNKDYHFAVLISFGSYTGLRFSDLSRLRWSDMDVPDKMLRVIEKKTKKSREIALNANLLHLLGMIKEELKPKESALLFPFSVQYANRKLKKIAKEHKLKIQYSTHTFRKTFGRRIWSNNDHSEKALLILSEMFNHTSPAITKRYLGIRGEEIQDVYLNL